MKGIIFTEFLELVEQKFGLGMVDKIINQSELKSGGIYTAVGTYEFGEMLQLISHLSQNTDISVDDLLMVYAEHLFAALIKSHPNAKCTLSSLMMNSNCSPIPTSLFCRFRASIIAKPA